uniref:B30.2/SPRY domain-containing protein n=1 Tax=Ditylenchus dipsaci TaxID=166011 RepID=A0A915E8U6_9BILA
MTLPSNFEGDGEDKELIFSEDFLTIEHSGKSEVTKISARSRHPIPSSCKLFYFEVTILQMNGKNARVGVGFKETHNSKYCLPGEQFDSYGLLTDGFFRCHRSQKVCERPIPAGSTIGCGIDLTYKRIFFTLKGKRIGHSIGIPLDLTCIHQWVLLYDLGEYTAYCQENSTHWLNRPVIGPLQTMMQPLTLEETLCRQNQSKLFYDHSHLHLPQHWNISDRRRSLLVSKCGMSVLLENMGRTDEEAATVRSNAPIPSSCPFITTNTISVGFSLKTAPLYELPGWNCKSIGYHGNEGKFFGCADWDGSDYGPAFESGDVIGCMLNFKHKEHFFTRNGKRLGNINGLMSSKTSSVFETNQGIYPAVGMVNKYAEVCANFGQLPFCFDLIQYAKELAIEKVPLTTIQNKDQQQQGNISPDLLNSSSSSCSPCNSVELVCQVGDSTNNDSPMLNCDRCDLNYHSNCLKPALSKSPTHKKKEWVCSKCEKALKGPHKVPVYAEVSPMQIITRVHPVKKFSFVSPYQSLIHTLSSLAVEAEEEEEEDEEDVQELSQNAKDAPLNEAYQSLRTADLFCNLRDNILMRNSKVQHASKNLSSRESSTAIEDDSCQRVDGQRRSGISNARSTTPRARRTSVEPRKRRRPSTPGPGSCSNTTVQTDGSASCNKSLQKKVIRLSESSVQSSPSTTNTFVQTPSRTYRTVETQTEVETPVEPTNHANHKETTIDMARQSTQQNTSNDEISNMKQIFYHYLKSEILEECKKVDDFICQKNCGKAIKQIERHFPEVFEKKKDLKILLEIYDYSDSLWRAKFPDSSAVNDKTELSDQTSRRISSADAPSTSGTSDAIKTETKQNSANLEGREALPNQTVKQCKLESPGRESVEVLRN